MEWDSVSEGYPSQKPKRQCTQIRSYPEQGREKNSAREEIPAERHVKEGQRERTRPDC